MAHPDRLRRDVCGACGFGYRRSDGVVSNFWTSTLRKRRKEHHCETCGQVVAAGLHSFDEAGLYDGDFSSFKQCRACHDIVAYFYWRGTLDSDGYQIDELAEYSRDEGLLWPPVWGFVEQDERRVA